MPSIKNTSEKKDLKHLINASINFLENKKFSLALSCIDKIKESYVFPDIDYYYSITYLYYGNEFFTKKKYAQAISLYIKSKSFSKNLEPKFRNEIYIKLASCYEHLNDFNKAKDVYKALINKTNKPSIVLGLLLYAKLRCGDWKQIDRLIEKIYLKLKNGDTSITPFTSIITSDSPNFQYLAAKNFSAKYINTSLKYKYEFKKAREHKRIRVAYLSSDFYNHATSHLIAGMFEYQNHKKFNYYAFSYGKNDNSEIAKRVKESFNNFFSLKNKSDQEISNLLINHEIDIAVDLKGHTKNNRLKILAKKPCPVQVSYLGFPGTLGTNFIDYLIMDKYLINKSNRKYFSENIIHLPYSYQCNERKILSNVSKRMFNLPDNKIILCSLNNSQKYNFSILDAWKSILHNNPNTILWLLNDNVCVKKNILHYFKQSNIKSDRIIFADKLDTNNHISRMSLADIFLDSFPCNAHTTASDALQADLPIVTMSGKTMSSRVSGSLLNTLGLNDLICNSYDDYTNKINYLINNKDKIQKMKNKIKNEKHKKLFNSRIFVGHVEEAYEKIWENYRNGNKIADIFI